MTKKEPSLLYYRQYVNTIPAGESSVHGNMQYRKSVFTFKKDGVELRENSGTNMLSGYLANNSVIANLETAHCTIKRLTIPLFLSRGYVSDNTNYAALPLGQRYLRLSPITSVIGLTLCVIWFLLWNNKVDVSSVASSYASVVKQGEVWRIVSSSFSHLTILHLAMNVSSLFSLSSLEIHWGSVQYLSVSLFLVVSTQLLLLLLDSFLIRCGRHSIETVWTLGYSCVLFALMTASILQRSGPCPVDLFGVCFPTRLLPVPFLPFAIPVNAFPFIQLLLMKLLVPNSSLLGHLAGVFMGFFLAGELPQWITPAVGCVAVELAYLAFHRSSRGVELTPEERSRSMIRHMVNSDTNAKYTIVHNISFITLLMSSVGIVVAAIWFCSDVVENRIAFGLSGVCGLFLCVCIKHYSRNDQLPGLLVVHSVTNLVSIASYAFRYVYELTEFEEGSLQKSLLAGYLFLSACFFSILSVLDTMGNLSSRYPKWFNDIVRFLLEPTKNTKKYVVDGFVFHNKMKRYDALTDSV
ncbi:hypothetical protein WA538_004596 [Blastocystis sp. DL]